MFVGVVWPGVRNWAVPLHRAKPKTGTLDQHMCLLLSKPPSHLSGPVAIDKPFWSGLLPTRDAFVWTSSEHGKMGHVPLGCLISRRMAPWIGPKPHRSCHGGRGARVRPNVPLQDPCGEGVNPGLPLWTHCPCRGST